MLKITYLHSGKKTLKQKRGTAIGTRFAPPYSILFMTELEEKIIKESEYKPIYGGGILTTYFSYGNMVRIN